MRTRRYKDIDGQMVPCQIDSEHDIWLIAIVLNELHAEKMIRQNLIAFEVHCRSVNHTICNEVAEKAVAIFPNLKTFTYGKVLRSFNRSDFFRVNYSVNSDSSSESEEEDEFMETLYSYMDDAEVPEFEWRPLLHSWKCSIHVDQYLQSSKVENFKFRVCDHPEWLIKICALENKK